MEEICRGPSGYSAVENRNFNNGIKEGILMLTFKIVFPEVQYKHIDDESQEG